MVWLLRTVATFAEGQVTIPRTHTIPGNSESLLTPTPGDPTLLASPHIHMNKILQYNDNFKNPQLETCFLYTQATLFI